MSPEVCSKLYNINLDFYKSLASEFDASRRSYWKTWSKLLPYFQGSKSRAFSVLDVGCGNGRFGRFLSDELGFAIDYVGVDADSTLLDFARTRYSEGHFHQVLLRTGVQDLSLEDPLRFLSPRKFDSVVLFGVLHHIPSFKARMALLSYLSRFLVPQGRLIFSTWEFAFASDFDASTDTLPWPRDIPQNELEPGDFLLDWSHKNIPRYCHNVTPLEAQSLLERSNLRLVTALKSLAGNDRLNRYYVASV